MVLFAVKLLLFIGLNYNESFLMVFEDSTYARIPVSDQLKQSFTNTERSKASVTLVASVTEFTHTHTPCIFPWGYRTFGWLREKKSGKDGLNPG